MVAVVICVLFPPLRTINSTISWTLQSNLPVTFTPLTCSSLCLSNRFNRAPPYISSLIICVRKLPVHSRNLLNSLCPPALLLQHVSGWLYISLWCISYFKWLQCFKTMFIKFLSLLLGWFKWNILQQLLMLVVIVDAYSGAQIWKSFWLRRQYDVWYVKASGSWQMWLLLHNEPSKFMCLRITSSDLFCSFKISVFHLQPCQARSCDEEQAVKSTGIKHSSVRTDMKKEPYPQNS